MEMLASQTFVSATKLIESEGCYFGIFDYSSPANRQGKWDEVFRAAKRKGWFRKWKTLFYLNQSWIDMTEAGALLSWITLFDGVFKIEARILAEEPKVEFGEKEIEHFLGQGENLLYCPTGNIIVDSLTRLGSASLSPLITVAPGTYRVGLVRR